MLARSLLPRWHDWLLQLDCTATNRQIQTAYDCTVAAYGHRDRVYHTLTHIAHVLAVLDRLVPDRSVVPALYAAVWFHDVVYDPRAKDNEWRSAQLADAILSELGIEAKQITEVKRLILLTQFHQVTADDSTGQWLLDADLAILGSEPALYQRYTQQIRQEYAWLDDRTYRSGRCQVLQQFLQRDRLYWHPLLRIRAEPLARQNLITEIQKLAVD